MGLSGWRPAFGKLASDRVVVVTPRPAMARPPGQFGPARMLSHRSRMLETAFAPAVWAASTADCECHTPHASGGERGCERSADARRIDRTEPR